MLRWMLLICALLSGYAFAIRIEIETSPDDPTSRLEYRPIIAPDGRELELLVVKGNPVRVTIDESVVVAQHIEFDFENRKARIVGEGRFFSEVETIEGRDFDISLSDETFQAEDVLIITSSLDIEGLTATRVPGQIDVLDGSFSPCRRCGQEIEDYGFRAERMLFYPGDRLVAYNVTILVRNVPAFFLPIAVFPLGPQERQPRLVISRGSAAQRAEVFLEWPYVVGANAFGYTSLRYYADVLPGAGNFFNEEFLGGAVEKSYIGFALEHRFITEEGGGQLSFDYTPAFELDSEEETFTEERLSFSLRYQTEETITPSTQLSLSRQDTERRQGLVEYSLERANTWQNLDIRILTRGYIDVEQQDVRPSYGSPYRTLAQLSIEPTGIQALTLGALSLSNISFDLGVFQDRSSPFNRSAAAKQEQEALRLLETHRLALLPLELWPGLELSGQSSFRGQYYSTAERLVDWQSALSASQSLAEFAKLDLSFTRNISEGESPFSFDDNRYGGSLNRTELRASLALTPFSWLSLETGESYTFLDTRNQDLEGFGIWRTSLTLFQDRPWIDLYLEQRYDVKAQDPGILEGRLTLRYEGDFSASLSLEHTEDLQPERDEAGALIEHESQTSLSLGAGYSPWFDIGLSSTYTYQPISTDEEALLYWSPLELVVRAGTLDQDDVWPGLQLDYSYDLDKGQATELLLEASARYQALEMHLEQGFNLDYFEEVEANPLASVSPIEGETQFELTWRNLASLTLTNIDIIPPALVGLVADTDANLPSRSISVELAEQALRDGRQLRRWYLAYETRYDPDRLAEDATEPGYFANSRLTANVSLDQRDLGDFGYNFKLNGTYLIADDALERSYLDSLSLSIQTQWFHRIGIQGELVYDGDYSRSLEAFSEQRLSFKEFAITARVLDDLYLSTVFGEDAADQQSDSWDFTMDNPYVFQPTVYVIWDRCCWAFHGRWDTSTGEISVFLGAAGAAEGIGQNFDTPLILPGREAQNP